MYFNNETVLSIVYDFTLLELVMSFVHSMHATGTCFIQMGDFQT